MASSNRTKPNPTSMEKVPKKIYYSISEASEYTGVEAHVLRYWETKFSKLNPKRVGGNQRKYTRNDLELIYEIIHLLYEEGYTLDGAEKKLKMGLQVLKMEREAERERLALMNNPQAAVPDPKNENRKALIKEIKNELNDILRLLE